MSFIRDKKTNAIINNDIDQYKNILTMRKKYKENRALMNEINVLKTKIAKIEQILGITDHE